MKLISELFWGWKANYLWHGTQWIGSVWKVWLELPSWRRSWKAHEEVPNWFANHDLKSFLLAFSPSTYAPMYLFTGYMSQRSKFSQADTNVTGVLRNLNPRFSIFNLNWNLSYKSFVYIPINASDHATSRVLSSCTNCLSCLTVSFVSEEERYSQFSTEI